MFMALLFHLFGHQAFPVLLVLSQWLWDMGSALLVYLVAMELFGERRVAFLAAFLFALHPIIVDISIRVSVEPLATFLLLAFVLTFLRALRRPEWFQFIWPGIFLGLSILSLAVLQFFPVLAVVMIGVSGCADRRKVLLAIATFCLSLITVWSPWVVRNYLALGEFVPAGTLGGLNLLRDHQTVGTADYLRFRDTQENEIAKKNLFAAEGIDLSQLSEVEQDKLFRKTALDFIFAYPDRYLILSIVRFFRLWFHQGLGSGPSMLSYVATLVNVPLMFLALLACLWFHGNWIRSALPLVALLGYGTVFYMATVAEVRYSVPFTPLLIIFSAYALMDLAARLSLRYKCGLRIFQDKETGGGA
jgi:4-amino-4-deoxy-L-arabinose transferase-like glycosyltransferase